MLLRPNNPTLLNLLVKPRIFFRFSGKNVILCILIGKMPFKMHKITFFSRIKKKISVPILPKISDLLPETNYFLFGVIKGYAEMFLDKMPNIDLLDFFNISSSCLAHRSFITDNWDSTSFNLERALLASCLASSN